MSNDAAETVEAMRRRARHRLIGATVLVVLGVIGFPMLFDTQPRPVAVDIPIDIPDKNKVAPLNPPPARAEQAANADPSPADGAVTAQSSLSGREEVMAAAGAAAKASADRAAASPAKDHPVAKDGSKPVPDPRAETAQKPAADREADRVTAHKPPAKPDEKPKVAAKAAAEAAVPNPADADAKPDAKAAAREQQRIAKAEEAARARALLQGKSSKEAAAAAEGRFIVQIGAFSESGRARDVRAKVERAGLKTYTQETKTASGTWFRVRVGPFATRAEADEAASKIKGLSLPASILNL